MATIKLIHEIKSDKRIENTDMKDINPFHTLNDPHFLNYIYIYYNGFKR
jgi:hypothetical protein